MTTPAWNWTIPHIPSTAKKRNKADDARRWRWNSKKVSLIKMKLSFVNRRRQKGIFSRQSRSLLGREYKEHWKRNFADVLVACLVWLRWGDLRKQVPNAQICEQLKRAAKRKNGLHQKIAKLNCHVLLLFYWVTNRIKAASSYILSDRDLRLRRLFLACAVVQLILGVY